MEEMTCKQRMLKKLHEQRLARLPKKLTAEEQGYVYTPSFRLADLVAPIELDWPPVLPPKDPNGQILGSEYQCAKKATASKTGIASYVINLKGAPSLHLHSYLEECLFRSFMMNPYVLDCRSQYPLVENETAMKYALLGKRIPENKKLTVDFLLTLQVPNSTKLHYHCVSGKRSEVIDEVPVVRRHLKEQGILEDWCTHEVMHESSFSDYEMQNNRRLIRWMDLKTIESSLDDIRRFSRAVMGTTSSKPAIILFEMLCRRLGLNPRNGRALFAGACFLGYLRCDHNHLLNEDRPIWIHTEKNRGQ